MLENAKISSEMGKMVALAGTVSALVLACGAFVAPGQAHAASKTSIENDTVRIARSVDYTGTAQKPSVEIIHKSAALKSGRDYTVAYKNNVNAGTAKVTITGQGAYCGVVTKTFTINKASIGKASIQAIKDVPYTDRDVVQYPKMKFNGKELTANKDFTVTMPSNRELGTVSLKVTGKGNFSGMRTISYKIVKASVADATVDEIPVKPYSGMNPVKPNPNVYMFIQAGDPLSSCSTAIAMQQLCRDKDYTVSYANNFHSGMATMCITGMGNYTGSKKVQFQIKAPEKTWANMKVVSKSGKSLKGLLFKLTNTATGKTTQALSPINAQGVFTFNLAPGTYTISEAYVPQELKKETRTYPKLVVPAGDYNNITPYQGTFTIG